jgi:serine protease Do
MTVFADGLPVVRACVVAAGLLLGGCNSAQPPVSPATPVIQPAKPVALADFADLVSTVSPGVVNISGILKSEVSAEALPEGHPPLGNPEENSEENPEGDPEENANEAQSLGSGFVINADGYIVTNYHVVSDTQQLTVTLSDQHEYPATVVGGDQLTDLALLKINADKLPVLKLADTRQLRVGQWVLAIGSPFGFDSSVTLGIVSAKDRTLEEAYVPFIQTDAAINPGNSGGPLFNLQGEVVGVNSQIYSETGGNAGIAFAIPAETIQNVVAQLKDKGKVSRGWLGVQLQKVTRALAQNFGLPKPQGALVAQVIEGSPAQQAGLKAGDVVLAVDDQPLLHAGELPPKVGSTPPGTVLNLKVLRDKKEIVVKVEVAELPASAVETPKPRTDLSAPNAAPPAHALAAGLEVRTLSDEERQAARLEKDGVLVLLVKAEAVRRAGILAGDILVRIDSQNIDSPARFQEVMQRLTPGRTVSVLLQRQGNPLFVALSVP